MQILKVIGLLMEYPDELLWECKDDALALVASDAPMLTEFSQDCSMRHCWINKRNGAKSLTGAGPPLCCCLSTCTPSPVTGVRRWLICWRSMKRSGYSSTAANYRITCRCIWSI